MGFEKVPDVATQKAEIKAMNERINQTPLINQLLQEVQEIRERVIKLEKKVKKPIKELNNGN